MPKNRMARPEDFEICKRAHAQGTLGVNWGMSGVHGQPSNFAKDAGWNLPGFLGLKKAFINKMLESASNFEAALISSGIDVYIPGDAR